MRCHLLTLTFDLSSHSHTLPFHSRLPKCGCVQISASMITWTNSNRILSCYHPCHRSHWLNTPCQTTTRTYLWGGIATLSGSCASERPCGPHTAEPRRIPHWLGKFIIVTKFPIAPQWCVTIYARMCIKMAHISHYVAKSWRCGTDARQGKTTDAKGKRQLCLYMTTVPNKKLSYHGRTDPATRRVISVQFLSTTE